MLSFVFPAIPPDVNLQLLLPELLLTIAGVLVMLVDAFTHRQNRRYHARTLLAVFACFGRIPRVARLR